MLPYELDFPKHPSQGVDGPSSRRSAVVGLQWPRGNHSSKPPLVYDIIDQMYPELSKIELFARHQHADRDVWGSFRLRLKFGVI